MDYNDITTKLYFIRNFKLGVHLFPDENALEPMVLLFIEPNYLENHIPVEIMNGEFSDRYNRFSNAVLEGIDIKEVFNKYRMDLMDDALIGFVKNDIVQLLKKKYGGYLEEALRFEFGRHFITNK